MLASLFLPWLYRWLNFSPHMLLPGFFGARPLAPTVRRQYTAPFKNAKERNDAVGFARALLHEQYWLGSLAQQITLLQNH